METKSENRRLTQVGPGTPMGELLRRYWWPVAVNSELAETPTRAVRLLGEDLVLFRTKAGQVGLVRARCAHRGFNMGIYAVCEPDGLRCPYHGWLYRLDGQCLETPPEPRTSTFKDRIHIPAYPVQELGGLFWAYLGPAPAPILPKWDVFAMPNAFRQVGQVVLPCNWLQVMENSVDTVHAEWLHGRTYVDYLERQGQPLPAYLGQFTRHHERIDFEPHPYGILKRRLLEGQSEEVEDWKYGHPLVFPNMVRLGGIGSGRYEMQVRVPVDDDHTWHLSYQCYVPPEGVEAPAQPTVPAFETPYKDEQGRYRLDYILAHDLVAWVGQGQVADRSTEKLATSDRGLILFRQILREQMEIVRQGGDPLNVFRDPADDRYIALDPDLDLTPEARLKLATYAFTSVRDGPTGSLSPVIDQIEALFRPRSESRA